MANVFLSYKREKREQVRSIVEALERSGFSVYWDTRLRAAVAYIQKLNAELLSADCVMVAWCPESIKSAWVQSECLKGFHRGNLLPIKIEPLDDIAIPTPFNGVHSIDLIGWNGSLEDRRWLTLKEDIQELIQRRSDRKAVEVSEEEDKLVMASELFPQVAAAGASIAGCEPGTATVDLGLVKSFIQELVAKNDGSVPHATVAQAIITRWPGQAGRYNWFGHRRFVHLFNALDFRDLRFSTAGAGSISRVPASGRAANASNVVSLPSAPAATAVAPVDDGLQALAQKVFSTSAPSLPPATYRALITALATAINGGAKTLAEISRQARDALAESPTPVSRARANFVLKGALIGGLGLDRKPVRPAMIAMLYVHSLIALCQADAIELSPLEVDRLLELIGFGDL